MSYYGFPKYVSVGEKKAKAEKKLKKLKKKNPDIQPVIIEGQALAKTWWGKEWNNNLERYADYSNRIGRGRSYVRHRAVLDLKIKPGRVEAQVSGSVSRPYQVLIKIKPIPKKNWAALKQSCKGKLDSFKKLIAGKFPKELGSIFTKEKGGLFPVPKEIDFSCSCPDWAYMCKHVAATLYGIGARLDEDPGLFFVLRQVDINDLVSETIKESKKELLSKARKKTSRIIEDESSLSDMFGIDLGEEIKAPKSVKNKKITAIMKIEQIISMEKKGILVSELIKKSGMEAQKVRNIVFRLKKMGKIDTVSRGIYRQVP
ncbi:SWIM zinc finger family protein [Desulfobacula sp.]